MKVPLNEIIPDFWKTMPREDLDEAFATGCLNERQSARLWHLLDHQGEPPKRMEILVSKDDVDRMIKSELRKRQR
jgi:hypothetical protein